MKRHITIFSKVLTFGVAAFMAALLVSGCGGSNLGDVLSPSTSVTSGQSVSAVTESVAELTDPNTGKATATEFVDTVPVGYFTNGLKIADSGATFLDMATCRQCHSSTYAGFSNTNHAIAWQKKAVTAQAQYGGISRFKDSLNKGTVYCAQCHSVTGPFIDIWNAEKGKYLTPTDGSVSAANAVKADHIYTKGKDIAAFGLDPIDETLLTSSGTTKILQFGGMLGTKTFKNYTEIPTEFQGIQCENCHGPASKHVKGGGDRGYIVGADRAARATTCNPCHDQYEEWAQSGHSKSLTGEPGHAVDNSKTSGGCAGCHTSEGFIRAVETMQEPKDFCASGNNTYSYCGEANVKGKGLYGKHAITCTVCHDPHSTGKGEQLRVSKEAICGKCHNSRYRVYYSGTTKKYDKIPGASRGVHQPQSEMFAGGSGGNGGVELSTSGAMSTYGYSTGTGTLKYKFVNMGGYMGATSCPDCHMHSRSDSAKNIKSLGHTFKPNGEACTSCHANYGEAKITEIQTAFTNTYNGLITRFNNMLKGNGVAGTAASTSGSYACSENGLSDDTKYRCCNGLAQDKGETKDKCSIAEYNLNIVRADHSKGVHNKPYADYLLKVSGDILTGLGY